MSTLDFPLNYSYNVTVQDNVTKLPEEVQSVEYYYQYNRSTYAMPLFDTSKVTTMSHMFSNASSLYAMPLFDTSNVTDMSYMFYYCSNIKSVPLFDTSKVTTMSHMFENSQKITTVPLFDTSNVTDMSAMFQNAYALNRIPLFDTSKVTTMNYMFYGSGIVTIPELDCSNVTTIQNMFNSSSNNKILNVGGFKNLGMQQSFTSGNNFMQYAQYITYDSLMNIINNLYDRATAGYSTVTLKFHANALAKLTDEDIAIATNKGWTIS